MSFHPNDLIRRGRAAAVLVAGAMVFLLSAFFRNQIIQHEQWGRQSEGNRLRPLPLVAPRGDIVDRHGKPIAQSAVAYTVSMLTTSEDTLRATMARLNEIIPLTTQDVNRAVRVFARDRNRPAVIFPDATYDEVSVLAEHTLDFPNLVIQQYPKRWYPAGAAVGAFVGFTREVTAQDLVAKEAEGYKSGQQIGKTGLEEQYEEALRGKEGARFVEVDAHGRVVGSENVAPEMRPVPGKSLRTTIDLDLQQFIHGIFGDSLIGAAVAMDPKTGGVLAFYSAPAVDPNRWIGGIPVPYYDSLRTDERKPLYNKALQGLYAPGSTFKLATSIIALQEGVVKFSDHMPQACGGYYGFGNRTWKCWKPEGHGSLDLYGAIANSCDVYFYQLGLKLAIARLAAGGVELGFVKRTGVDLPLESKPVFPPGPDMVAIRAYYDRQSGPGRWTAQSEVLNLAIGQGANSQSVLNMARFYTALANRGLEYKPHFADVKVEPVKIFKLSPEQAENINKALVGVTTFGTAALSAMKGVQTAGKTGTAQSGKFVNGHELNHAWFAGYAPADDPKIVVALMIEYGGHGTRSAAIVQKIFEYYLKTKVAAANVTGE